ncbi:Ig-like domain-containing protein, partial [Providencia rettgeri]|uniref:Ig-like domain-containing protein n=1 Tax=Providencia rettgeri TaxID=587 RepID=UPI0023AB4A09
TVTDLAGNTSTGSGQFVVDTQTTLIASLNTESQSEQAVDGITTNLLRPQISGVSEPNSKIVAEFKGTNKTIYSDAKGHWSLVFDVNATAGKDNQYRITAEDLAGNKETIDQKFTFIPTENGVSDAPPPVLSVSLDEDSDSGKKGDYITNVNTLKFSGMATKSAKVSFNIEGKVYETTADKITGEWRIVTDVLQDGNNRYTATVTHPVNGRTLDVQGSVFIDSTPPFTTVELTSETDSGVKGNFITSHRKPVFTGLGEPGCEVELTLNNEVVKTTIDSNGQWTLHLNNELPEQFTGDYNIVVSDTAGHQYKNKNTLVIDNTPPNISEIKLESPWKRGKFHGDQSTNDLTPTFSGKVTPSSTAFLELKIDAVGQVETKRFPITNINQDGEWSFSLPKGILIKDRRYSINDIFVTATSPSGVESKKEFDKRGMQVKSSVLNITSGVAEESSTTGLLDKHYSGTRSPQLQGTISGSSDRDELSGVIDIGGKRYSLSFANSRRDWSVKLPEDMPLALGETPYTLTFTDVYGSEQTFSSHVIVAELNAWLDIETDSGKSGDNTTNHKKPVYMGKVDIGTKLLAKLGANEYPINVNEKGEWRFEVPIQGNGVYEIVFIKEYNGVSQHHVKLTVDNTVPEYSKMWVHWSDIHEDTMVSIKNDFRFYNNYESNIDYLIVDVNGKKYKLVDFYSKFDGATTQIGGMLSLPNGEHLAKVTAVDIAGNKLEHEITFNVLGGDEGQNSPKIVWGINDKQLISADGGKLNFNNLNLNLVGKTSPASLIEIKDSNGKVIGFTKANNDGNWRISLPKTFIPFDIKNSDEIPLTVTAKDLIGRETHLNFDLVYDVTPPEITAELEDLLSLGNQTNDSTPTLSGQTKSNADVYITLDGKEHKTTADPVGHWQLTIPDEHVLKDGHYDYQVKAVDILGQVSTSNINGSVHIKTTPQIEGGLDTASDSGLKDDHCTNNQKPKLSGVTEPNTDVRVIFDGNFMQPYETKSDHLGHWSIDVTSELAEGLHEYVIIVNDVKQGIRGEIKGELTVDLTPPTELTAGIWSEQEQSVKNKVLTNITTPTFKGHTEPFGLIKLSISKAGSHSTEIYQEVSADKQGNWQFILPISSALDDGKYVYHVAIEDSAGNLGEAHTEHVGFITVDTQAPELSDVEKDVLTNENKPTLTGKTEAGLQVKLEIDGKTYHDTADKQGQWSIQIDKPLADKAYDYVLTVEDAAGNQTEQKGQLTVD